MAKRQIIRIVNFGPKNKPTARLVLFKRNFDSQNHYANRLYYWKLNELETKDGWIDTLGEQAAHTPKEMNKALKMIRSVMLPNTINRVVNFILGRQFTVGQFYHEAGGFGKRGVVFGRKHNPLSRRAGIIRKTFYLDPEKSEDEYSATLRVQKLAEYLKEAGF